MNRCGITVKCGIDPIHIDPLNAGRRFVPFRAEKRLFRCTRAHALRWQITPRWGWMAAYHSTSSLADHAPLGLDTFEPVACDRIDPTVKTDADPIPAAPTGRNLIAKGVNPGKG